MIINEATPMLKELAEISRGYAADALNYASIKMQKSMQSKAKSYGKSNYGSRFSKGHRLLSGSKQNGVKGDYYSRFNKKTLQKEHGLDEFIKYQVSDKFLYSLIGFIDMKGHSANIYRDGKKTGSRYVKGQKVKEIGHAMEYGGKQELSEKQKGLFFRSGWKKAAERGFITRKARPVVNPTYSAMRGQIQGIIADKFVKALTNKANNTRYKGRVA